MEVAPGLAAVGAEAVGPSIVRARRTRSGIRFAKGFGTVGGAWSAAALIVAALAVAILRSRAMTGVAVRAVRATLALAVVALVAALTVRAAVGLGRGTTSPLRLLGLLRRGLETLEGVGGLDEVRRK